MQIDALNCCFQLLHRTAAADYKCLVGASRPTVCNSLQTAVALQVMYLASACSSTVAASGCVAASCVCAVLQIASRTVTASNAQDAVNDFICT